MQRRDDREVHIVCGREYQLHERQHEEERHHPYRRAPRAPGKEGNRSQDQQHETGKND